MVERDEFRLAFFVDGAVGAVVEPLEVHADAHAEPVLDKSVLPVDAALVVKGWRIDELSSRDLFTALKVEFPVAKAEADLHDPVQRMGVVEVLVAECRFDRVGDGRVRRVIERVVSVRGVELLTHGPARLDQVVGVFVTQSKAVKDIARFP